MITSVFCQPGCLCSAHRRNDTIEIRRQRRMICNAREYVKTDSLNHELTFGKELESEAFEQVALDILACETEAAQFDSS